MDAQNFEFSGDVCDSGYHWIDAESEQVKTGSGKFLTDGIPLGTSGFTVRRYQPLKAHTGLFRIFSDTEASHEGVQTFATKYGMLGGDEGKLIALSEYKTEKGTLVGVGELLSYWRHEILYMRQAVSLWHMARSEDTERLLPLIQWDDRGVRYISHPDLDARDLPDDPYLRSIAVIADEQRHPERFASFRRGDVLKPALHYVQQVINNRLKGRVSPRLLWTDDRDKLGMFINPSSLIGALWLQFALAIESNNEFRACERCGDWFEIRAGRGRKDRAYCSNACRNRAYRLRKAGEPGTSAE